MTREPQGKTPTRREQMPRASVRRHDPRYEKLLDAEVGRLVHELRRRRLAFERPDVPGLSSEDVR